MSRQLTVVEAAGTESFGPLTDFRAPFELVCGILPLWRKMEMQYDATEVTLLCRESLTNALRRRVPTARVNEWPSGAALLLDGRIIGDAHMPEKIPLDGPDDVVFMQHGAPIAARLGGASMTKLRGVPLPHVLDEAAERFPHEEVDGVHVAHWPWELVHQNPIELFDDFGLLRSSDAAPLHEGRVDKGAYLECPQRIHIGRDSRVYPGAVLVADDGPIYIADRVTILPGAVIMGPVAIGEGATIKVHAKIYAGTTIGPVCKVGGEVEETIFHGYSNKQHDGFLGHSYIGEWVNLGAGTNNSDLKNNYSHVRVRIAGREVDTGERFVGLIMGDHTKSGIGTTFNTGSVVGSCCNIFGAGLPPKEIPSFAWGGAADGFVRYDIERFLKVARIVMGRRKMKLEPEDEQLIRDLYSKAEVRLAAAGVHAGEHKVR